MSASVQTKEKSKVKNDDKPPKSKEEPQDPAKVSLDSAPNPESGGKKKSRSKSTSRGPAAVLTPGDCFPAVLVFSAEILEIAFQ